MEEGDWVEGFALFLVSFCLLFCVVLLRWVDGVDWVGSLGHGHWVIDF